MWVWEGPPGSGRSLPEQGRSLVGVGGASLQWEGLLGGGGATLAEGALSVCLWWAWPEALVGVASAVGVA